MGDLRFQPSYARVRDATNRVATLRALSDEEVIEALAAASARADPLFANFLATEAVNRLHRARRVFEHIREGVVATDRSGRVTLLNPAAERMLGWTHGEAAGLLLDDVLRVYPTSSHQSASVDLFPEGTKEDGLRITSARVEGRWPRRLLASLRAVPIYLLADVVGLVVTLEDIASPHEGQAARDALLALSEGLEEGVFGSDLDGRIVIWNAACERLYGFRAQDAIGKLAHDLIFPAEVSSTGSSIARAIEGGERVRERDAVRVRKDGARIHVSVTVLPVRDREGRISGAVSLQRSLASTPESGGPGDA